MLLFRYLPFAIQSSTVSFAGNREKDTRREREREIENEHVVFTRCARRRTAPPTKDPPGRVAGSLRPSRPKPYLSPPQCGRQERLRVKQLLAEVQKGLSRDVNKYYADAKQLNLNP